jgi:hypothetical protein
MDVEQAFSMYVKSIGGELVSELLPKSPTFENADFLFRKRETEPVIAELKCLTKDLLKEGYQEKLEKLFEDWINRRLVPPFHGRFVFKSEELPRKCQEELFRMLGRRVKKDVVDANRQIKETKKHFGLGHAKGLLLLANDGNYSLEFDVLLYLVDRALGRDCSGINSVICFTLNMRARMPGVERDGLFWVPANRTGIPSVSSQFLDRLRDDWVKFHSQLIGERVPTFRAENNEAIKDIRFIQPPTPREYFLTRNRALVNLRREIAEQLDRIIQLCRAFDVGRRDEVIHVAHAARMILYGTPKARPLLREYFGDKSVHLRSTTMVKLPDDSHYLGFMGLEANTGRFRPLLDDTKRNTLLPFHEWWNEPVIRINQQNETITRMAIILLAAGGQGCAGLDARMLGNYEHLVTGLGMKALVKTKDGRDVTIVFQRADLAALRQIGHELLTSPEIKSFIQ